MHASTLSLLESSMAERPPEENSFPKDRYTNPETALGGADAVEKTTYVTGQGGEPETIHKQGTPTARVPSGSGHGATWAIIGFLAVMAVLVYLLGFGR
ncbi:MAG TPA: hypothetical protein VF461_21720 [Gemmatimonadaceae bacterium]